MSIFDFIYNHKDILPIGIRVTEKEISVTNYLKVNDSETKVFEIDILSKIQNDNGKDWEVFDKYFSFIDRIKSHIVKLNHMGFGYKTQDVESELDMYRKQMGREFDLVEEDSGDKDNNRWFFIKPKDRSIPKIELILYPTDKYKDYCPQFQMDMDTDLSYEEIEKTVVEIFGRNIFFWKYDIPGYGVVMAMGKVGEINGVKILFGVGTNLRQPQTFDKI